MPKITIRSKEGWNNRNRNIGVYLDGRKIDMIISGQTIEFEIESGEHQLKAKSGIFGTKNTTINLHKDENKNIELSGSNLWLWLVSLALLIGVLFLIIGTPFRFL
jgi:hypothetical protein